MSANMIRWELSRLRMPQMKAAWFRAVGTCDHGQTVQRVIAPKPWFVERSSEALAAAHRQDTGCDCRVVEMTVLDVEVDP